MSAAISTEKPRTVADRGLQSLQIIFEHQGTRTIRRLFKRMG